jgi:spore germination cell wall hydrolase CwlJ-like protein
VKLLKIIYSKSAVKAIKIMDNSTKQRIKSGIEGLMEIPPKGDIKQLQGLDRIVYRLRIGKYRVIYEYIRDEHETLFIKDIDLLARAIHAETKGEPYLGQVAVGAVMLNRVTHPSFPNTLAGVIYQPCAFEPIKRGAINEAPDASACNAARDALDGWDPTGGAVYFWNPSSATSGWIWTRKVTLSIGKHVFAHD